METRVNGFSPVSIVGVTSLNVSLSNMCGGIASQRYFDYQLDIGNKFLNDTDDLDTFELDDYDSPYKIYSNRNDRYRTKDDKKRKFKKDGVSSRDRRDKKEKEREKDKHEKSKERRNDAVARHSMNELSDNEYKEYSDDPIVMGLYRAMSMLGRKKD